MLTSFTKKVSAFVSQLFIFNNAAYLWQENQKNFWLPLSKWQKLYLGIYIILHDYAQGLFPPTFEDQQAAYDGEIKYFFSLPGVNPSDALESDMRKPFWFGGYRYINYFLELCKALEKCGIQPPNKILELGAGSGWMSEFLALMNFQAIATTIGDNSIEQIKMRIDSLEKKALPVTLKCYQTPMESVANCLKNEGILPVDAVFVFEALHHAYDWKKTFQSSFDCLKSGGWFLICREPNILHTFISYRIAKLSNTHEIGLSRSALIRCLKNVGFSKIIVLNSRLDFFVKPHWIIAQK